MTIDRMAIANNSSREPGFMLIFICAAWHIWKQRNDLIFERDPPSAHRWLVNFKQELLTNSLRTKEAHRIAILDWLSSLDGNR